LVLVADRLAQTDSGLLVAVRAGFARAVQEEDDGIFLLAVVLLRHEDRVLRLAVLVLVNLVMKAGLVLTGVQQGQIGDEQAAAEEQNQRGPCHGISSLLGGVFQEPVVQLRRRISAVPGIMGHAGIFGIARRTAGVL